MPGNSSAVDISLTAGPVALRFSPQRGGRIMSLQVRGEEWLFQGPDTEALPEEITPLSDLLALKQAWGFKIWGGDRTWIAPEKAWLANVPPLELDSAPYQVEVGDSTVRMTSPECRETGLRITRVISLTPGGIVHLREEIQNVSSCSVSRGIWNVTQIRRPFTVFLPALPHDVRSYHHENPSLPEPRVNLLMLDGQVGIPCVSAGVFKFGVNLLHGQCLTRKSFSTGDQEWARHFEITSDRPYAHQAMVEVFNAASHDYGEVEIHAPLQLLAPQASVSFEQTWLFR